MVQGAGCRVQGAGCRVQGGFGVKGDLAQLPVPPLPACVDCPRVRAHHLRFGVGGLALGVWGLVFGVWCLVFVFFLVSILRFGV